MSSVWKFFDIMNDMVKLPVKFPLGYFNRAIIINPYLFLIRLFPLRFAFAL